MASLKEIRTALQTTINTIVGLHGYDNVSDVAQVPAAVIAPDVGDFTGAFQRGMDTWMFDVFVLVGRRDFEVSQEELDGFLTGAGDKSIRQAVYTNPTLGLTDGTDAFVSGVRGYGGEFQTAKISHVGAIIKVTVRTPGTA